MKGGSGSVGGLQLPRQTNTLAKQHSICPPETCLSGLSSGTSKMLTTVKSTIVFHAPEARAGGLKKPPSPVAASGVALVCHCHPCQAKSRLSIDLAVRQPLGCLHFCSLQTAARTAAGAGSHSESIYYKLSFIIEPGVFGRRWQPAEGRRRPRVDAFVA